MKDLEKADCVLLQDTISAFSRFEPTTGTYFLKMNFVL
jgi:hypothetical protein